MICVGICDDEKQYRESVYDATCKALFQYDDVEFAYYEDGEAVIEAIESNEFSCELLMLDIHMAQVDGLKVAQYIRQHQIDVDIIFVTVSAEHVFDGYTYQAFSYLLKPVDEVRLIEELDRYMKLKSNSSNCLHVAVNGKKVQLLLDRVKYFDTDGRKLNAHLVGDQVVSFYAKMNELQETLKEDDFLRCHQSFLVNAKFVKSHSRAELEIDDMIIPISRRYIEDVRARLG